MNIDALTTYLALSSGSYSGILRDMYAVHNLGLNPDLHTKLLANRFVGVTKELSGIPPLSFKSKGKPLTAWSITGNTVQDGTPTPENPVEVVGVGDRTGNLFDKHNTTIYNAYFNASGNWLLNANSKSIKCPCLPNTQYTISVPNEIVVFRIYESSNPNLEPSQASREHATQITRSENIKQYTFTTSSTAKILLFQGSNDGFNEWFNGLMLVEGSTAPSSYIPYGYKIPVATSADGTEPITTPIYLDSPLYKIGNYADRLSNTEEVRVVKELVLTGEENFSYDDTYTRFTLKIPNARATSNRSDETPCTHYISIHDGRSIYDVPDDSIYVTVGGGYVYINIKDITYTSLADFKSYLAAQYAAGTPVKVYYVMKTPETKPVEPVEIPTLNGTTVIDVDTAVKPESMTIKYRR